MKTTRDDNEGLGINSKPKRSTHDSNTNIENNGEKIIQNYQRKCFPLILYLQSHLVCLSLLRCVSYTIILRESLS
jgi:hypothetical protein